MIANITDILRPVAHLFDHFEQISGLALGHSKCIVVPLCPPEHIPNFKLAYHKAASSWKDFPIKLHAEYLGFQLGPEAHLHQWSAPIRKAIDTAHIWHKLNAGFLLNILAMNTYLLPLFNYKAQLTTPTPEVHQAIQHCQNKLFIGPGGWIPSTLLLNLTLLGFPTQIRSTTTTSQSSQIRMSITTTIDIQQHTEKLGPLKIAHDHTYNYEHPYTTWHNDIFAINILTAQHNFTKVGGTLPDTHNRNGGKRKGLQKKIQEDIEMMLPSKRPQLHELLGNRLVRFQLDTLPGKLALRVENRLQHLQKEKTKPAVVAVYIRTLLNGWSTHRRMRSMAQLTLDAFCPFCLSAQDSLEHFARCPIIAKQYEAQGIIIRSIAHFFALDINSFPESTVKLCRLLSAVYLARNTLIHSETSLSSTEVLRYTCQSVCAGM